MGRQELISVTDEAARRGDSSFWPKLLFCNASRRLGLRPLDVFWCSVTVMHKPIGLSPFAGRSACTESTIMMSLNRPRVCRLLLSEVLQQVSQLRLLAVVVAVNLHDYISLSLSVSVCLSFSPPLPSPPPPIHPYIRTRCNPLPSPHQSIRTQIIFHCLDCWQLWWPLIYMIIFLCLSLSLSVFLSSPTPPPPPYTHTYAHGVTLSPPPIKA